MIAASSRASCKIVARFDNMAPAAAVDAFNIAFERLASDLIAWTAEAP